MKEMFIFSIVANNVKQTVKIKQKLRKTQLFFFFKFYYAYLQSKKLFQSWSISNHESDKPS